MTRRYTASGFANAAGTGAATAIGITPGSTVIALVDCITVGPGDAPNSTDCSARIRMGRTTAAGTGTSVTPLFVGLNSIAASSTALAAHTVEPTFVSGQTLLDISINQRASLQYQVQDGREFVSVAGAGNGIAAGIVSAGQAYKPHVQIWWKE